MLNLNEKLLIVPFCARPKEAMLEAFHEKYAPTVYYFNPDCSTQCEFERDSDHWHRVCEETRTPVIFWPGHLTDNKVVAGMVNEMQQGDLPCLYCYSLRISQACFYASTKHYPKVVFLLEQDKFQYRDAVESLIQRASDRFGVTVLPLVFMEQGEALE